MHKTGQHFTEGTQYETALLHQRMRNRQPGRIDHPVVIKKNIDIEGTRTVLPAHRFMIRPCGLITTGSGLASGSGCDTDTVCRSRTDPPRLPLDLLANIEHMFRLQSRLEDQNLIEKLFRRLESQSEEAAVSAPTRSASLSRAPASVARTSPRLPPVNKITRAITSTGRSVCLPSVRNAER